MNRIFLVFVSVFLTAASLIAQDAPKYVFTLDDVVQLAKEQSPQAILARHRFRASYFSFMEYRANFLPKLTLTANPTTWNHSIQMVETINRQTGEVEYYQAKKNTFNSTAGLALSQNIGLTGGNISLGSDFSRLQNFNDTTFRAKQFTTNPIGVSLRQPLNGYNQFRWLKAIEPLRFEEAKQNYLVQMERVAANAVSMFFSLAIAQVNLKMAQTNLENQERLYDISKGRHQLGRIAEDQLLQVQLRYMQAESSYNNAQIQIHSSESQLRSFLGFRDDVKIELVIEPKIPSFTVNYEEALGLALSRNPEIIANNRQILEAESAVAQARAQKGITMNMNASFGLNKTGYTFNDAYTPAFDNTERISVGITVPILDWSQARNRLRNAQSILEVTEAQAQQNETEFKQNIFLYVMRFNMQENQLRIAAMSDTIAQKSYDISYARYMIGQGDITVLNIADTAKDNAKIGFMGELRYYWDLYYMIRRLTLFDFQNNRPLEEDFDLIIGE